MKKFTVTTEMRKKFVQMRDEEILLIKNLHKKLGRDKFTVEEIASLKLWKMKKPLVIYNLIRDGKLNAVVGSGKRNWMNAQHRSWEISYKDLIEYTSLKYSKRCGD